MPQADTSAVVKNIVLVHGGFVDGSGWQVYTTAVASPIEQAGRAAAGVVH